MHSSSLDYRGAYQLMMPFIFLSALVSVSSRNIACDCYIQHNSRNRPDRGIEGLKKKKTNKHRQTHGPKLGSGGLDSWLEKPQSPGNLACLLYRSEQKGRIIIYS